MLLAIWEESTRQVFAPGFVFPYQESNDQGEVFFQGCWHRNPSPNTFLAFDRGTLSKYRKMYFEENTWAIGTIHPGNTVRFLDWIEDNYLHIKSLYLSFSMNDTEGLDNILSWAEHNLYSESGRIANNLLLLERFAALNRYCTCQLLQIWWSKFSHIVYLNLDEFT